MNPDVLTGIQGNTARTFKKFRGLTGQHADSRWQHQKADGFSLGLVPGWCCTAVPTADNIPPTHTLGLLSHSQAENSGFLALLGHLRPSTPRRHHPPNPAHPSVSSALPPPDGALPASSSLYTARFPAPLSGSLPHLLGQAFILFVFSFLTQPTEPRASCFSAVPATLRRESPMNWMLSKHVTSEWWV